MASSAGTIVKNTLDNNSPSEYTYTPEEILFRDTTAYALCVYDPSGQLEDGPVYFDLENPGYIEQIASAGYPLFTGGTWTLDLEWLVCDSINGYLWEINPDTGDASLIGGGGVGLNGLTYDPNYNELYGCSSSELYKIDRETGAQTYIGSFGRGPVNMIGLACNLEGYLYGWDLGTDNLWMIDIETAECDLVGSLGIDLNYQQDGHFDLYEDILYLAAYTTKGQLYECDKETGECYLIGDFQGGAELTALAIPYIHNPPPVTNISFDPPEPDGCNGWYVSNVVVTLNATDIDSDVNVTYYRINGGNWQIIPGGYGNFILSDDGEDILIEYYSVDVDGNAEDIKSATIDIDQTPPWIRVEWDVTKVGWRKWMVSFTLSVTDNTSGIDRIDIFLNDVLQETITGPGPVYGWSMIISGELHITFKFVAWDMACNQANVSIDDSEINSHSHSKSIFTQQSNHLRFLQFFDRFPIIQRLLDVLGRNIK